MEVLFANVREHFAVLYLDQHHHRAMKPLRPLMRQLGVSPCVQQIGQSFNGLTNHPWIESPNPRFLRPGYLREKSWARVKNASTQVLRYPMCLGCNAENNAQGLIRIVLINFTKSKNFSEESLLIRPLQFARPPPRFHGREWIRHEHNGCRGRVQLSRTLRNAAVGDGTTR